MCVRRYAKCWYYLPGSPHLLLTVILGTRYYYFPILQTKILVTWFVQHFKADEWQVRIPVQPSESRFCSLPALSLNHRWGMVKIGWKWVEQPVPSLEDLEEQVEMSTVQCLLSSPAPSQPTQPRGKKTSGDLGHQWIGLELLLRGLLFHMPGAALSLQSPPLEDLLPPPHDLSFITEFSSFSHSSVPLLHSISTQPIRFFAGCGCSSQGWEPCCGVNQPI